MSPVPRVFIVRHGETEWSLNGRHTGTSDIPLTSNGEKRIKATGHALVGDDRLIVPRKLAHILVSPRQRAQRTLGLLFGSENDPNWREKLGCKIETTDEVREWDYGDYEGITSKDIAKGRAERGESKWDIWRDGCPGGESPEDVTRRLDAVIASIRERFHASALEDHAAGVDAADASTDVLIVAHGHILRAFAGRWINKSIADNPSLLLDAGGVGTLSYEHHSLYEPAILLGGAFVVDVVEKEENEHSKPA